MTATFEIFSNVTCSSCCNDYKGKLNLGNAKEKSPEDIFTGEKATYVRDIEKGGKFIVNRCKICRGNLVY